MVPAPDGSARLLTPRRNKVFVWGGLGEGRKAVLRQHKGVVTAMVPHPGNRTQVLTACEDGSVRVFDVSDGAMLKEMQVGAPIAAMACPGRGTHVYLSIGKPAAGDAAAFERFLEVELRDQEG